MYFGLIVMSLMVVCLAVYFIYNKKLKFPTRLTEFLITGYNKKIKKVHAFCKKNQLNFNSAQYLSFLEDGMLNFENLEANIKTIKKIEENKNILEKMINSKTKEEFFDCANKLNKNCKFYQFKDEINIKNQDGKILYIFGVEKTKLDFEMQKYFGSQYFFKYNQKYFILNNSLAYVVDEKNIFDSKVVPYNLIIKECETKNEENKDVFELIIEEIQLDIKVLAPQKEVKKYLKSIIKLQDKNIQKD